MSKALTEEITKGLRDIIDFGVEVYGEICLLNRFIEEEDDLREEGVKVFDDPEEVKVILHWSPDVKKLKSLGIHYEETIPVIAQFKFADNVTLGSWIEIPWKIIEGEKKERLEVKDRRVVGRGRETKLFYVLVPKREI